MTKNILLKQSVTNMEGCRGEATVMEMDVSLHSFTGEVTLSGVIKESVHLDSNLHEDPEAV